MNGTSERASAPGLPLSQTHRGEDTFPMTSTAAGRRRMIILPPPEEASRITRFLGDHLRWSVFWDKRDGVWRVAEDDPDSDLYAECPDANTVIGYITAHV